MQSESVSYGQYIHYFCMLCHHPSIFCMHNYDCYEQRTVAKRASTDLLDKVSQKCCLQ